MNENNKNINTISDEWFKATIDRNQLKKLSKRSNWPGFRHIIIYFLSLFISAYLAYYTWGTWWCIFWLWIYGIIFYASNPIWHETGHRTAFKSRFINNFFYQISSFMTDFEPTRWRWSHTMHHSYTSSTVNPHDYEAALFHTFPKPLTFFLSFVPFIELLRIHKSLKFEIIQHAFGIITPVMRDCIPENYRWKCRMISRIHVSIWLISIILSFIIMNPLPALLIFFPRYWGNIVELFNQTQHIGLPENIKDHRYTTRSIRLNPIFSFLYWKMEYHVEHHMFPMVPSYNLPKLHELTKNQLPKPNTSLYNAYKEIIPALIKQYKDNNYFIKKQIPIMAHE